MPTPYEIREHLLSRATDYLQSKFHAEFSLAESTKNIASIAQLKYPTTEEIIALAEVYKNFIDKK